MYTHTYKRLNKQSTNTSKTGVDKNHKPKPYHRITSFREARPEGKAEHGASKIRAYWFYQMSYSARRKIIDKQQKICARTDHQTSLLGHGEHRCTLGHPCYTLWFHRSVVRGPQGPLRASHDHFSGLTTPHYSNTRVTKQRVANVKKGQLGKKEFTNSPLLMLVSIGRAFHTSLPL